MSVKAVIKNKIDKNGKTQIFIRITKNRQTNLIATPYKVKVKNWNSKKGLPRANKADLRKKIKELVKTVDEWQDQPLEEIKRAMGKPKKNVSFFDLAERIIEEHRLRKSYQTMKTYKGVISKLLKYTKKDIAIISISVSFLHKYQSHLLNINAPNTVHKDLKTIRAIYYRAIREGLVSKESNPFFIFKLTLVPVERPKLTMDEVNLLANANLVGLMQEVRDIFMLCLYSGGMRIGDALRLKVSNIDVNTLDYRMSKTGKLKRLTLIPNALNILEGYMTDKGLHQYIFPFLTERKDEIEIARQVAAKTALINKYLKKVAKTCGIDKSLSTHIARHTFADLARKNGASLYDISKTLGHSSLKITEQYLSSFDEETTSRVFKGLF